MGIFTSVLFGLLYCLLVVAVLYTVSIVWSNATLICSKVSKATQFVLLMVKYWIRSLFLKAKKTHSTSIPELELNDIEIPCGCTSKKEIVRPTSKKPKSKEIEREGNKGLIQLSLYVFLSLLVVGLLRMLFGK